MSKLPWYKFFPADWMNDPNLSKCTPGTRGIWKDLICAMHQSDRSGELRGTPDQLARLSRCSTVELTQALTELQTTGTADVTFRNKDVTVVNRKMKRESKSRTDTALRVKKHRSNGECNAPVTPKKSEDRSQKTDLLKDKAIKPGEWNHYPRPETELVLNEFENGGTREWIVALRQTTLSVDRVAELFVAFRLKLTGEKFYQSRGDLIQHFRNWLKDQKIEAVASRTETAAAPPLKRLSSR